MTSEKRCLLCDRMEALTDALVVLILQFVNISNQHVYLTLHNVMCQLYLSKAGK